MQAEMNLDIISASCLRQYLGEEGLGCFTSGKYPLTHPEAGMLGYVQSNDETTWAAKIAIALTRAPDAYCIADNTLWDGYQITPQLVYTYRSRHHCQTLGEDIDIFHTLLRFC
jgi:hypothetical protein